MVLVSQNAPHSVKRCSENDIVINFLLTREYLNGTFLNGCLRIITLQNFLLKL